MAASRYLIKKYANRKLYDTRTSRYITLPEISRLVREGADIQVVERDSGRDLTSLVLSQLVMDEEKHGESGGADSLQDRGQALLGYMRRTLRGPASAVSGEVERRRAELEEFVERAVERALGRLSISTRRDLDVLSRRLDDLESRIDEKADIDSGERP